VYYFNLSNRKEQSEVCQIHAAIQMHDGSTTLTMLLCL